MQFFLDFHFADTLGPLHNQCTSGQLRAIHEMQVTHATNKRNDEAKKERLGTWVRSAVAWDE